MAEFKCKTCGAPLQIEKGMTVIECSYCHVKQTLPKLDDDRRLNMYDKANHFRRNCEFDKAIGIYEQILTEDDTDAEAYWSLVLCKYGIEYVEDKSTHRRVLTMHRAQYTSIFDDENYKSALACADSLQRAVCEQEAKKINEIQKGFLAISLKEKPYDVFICFKDTDDNTKERTHDSVLAQDLYQKLTNEGYKVFFSRITLEGKLGVAYEPYIFAALNSAKVMVVLGTKPEYFNAVWVKNEWSRFLSLIKQGKDKTLIPAYKNMSPYDLPTEFSHLQAQDMSKIGFMQDLLHGIEKLIPKEQPKEQPKENVTVISSNVNTATVDSLLQRVWMFCEDGEWTKADEYCEKVLDIKPQNALAYLGKLMIEHKVRKRSDFELCAKPFDYGNNYEKVMRFGDEELKSQLEKYLRHVKDRNKETRKLDIYNRATQCKKNGTEKDLKQAAELFESISGYRDSAYQAAECKNQAEVVRKDDILQRANAELRKDTIASCEEAIKLYATIPGWRDADAKKQQASFRIGQLRQQAIKAEKQRKREARRDYFLELLRYVLPIPVAIGLDILLTWLFTKDAENMFNFFYVLPSLIIAIAGGLLYRKYLMTIPEADSGQ